MSALFSFVTISLFYRVLPVNGGASVRPVGSQHALRLGVGAIHHVALASEGTVLFFGLIRQGLPGAVRGGDGRRALPATDVLDVQVVDGHAAPQICAGGMMRCRP